MKIGIVGAGNVGCACAMAATVCGSAREIVLITSQVFLWSSVRIAGVPVAELLKKRGQTLRNLREKVEREVRYDNITIIEDMMRANTASESFARALPKLSSMTSARRDPDRQLSEGLRRHAVTAECARPPRDHRDAGGGNVG
jgi:malate/lactate dehydrogenase